MSKEVRRGYLPEDEKMFTGKQYEHLCKATNELRFLLDAGYPIKPASTFIGNHYMFTERQRMSLTRTVSTSEALVLREEKRIQQYDNVSEVNIDGFNTVITLEVAFSKSPLLLCMDQTIRDLAGLRGTYRIIDKTELAIHEIFSWLERSEIRKANVYLDAPVSNSGRLKMLFLSIVQNYPVSINVEVINDVDRILEQSKHVITSDAIILDRCQSWINMNREIIERMRNIHVDQLWIVNLME